MNRSVSFVLLVLTMAACGGDDGGTVPDEILPLEKYYAKCEQPRTSKDFPDQQGTLLDEQLFLRSLTDQTYLWYQEVPKANPKMFDTAVDYFDVLKTFAITASKKPKDQFHFTEDTAAFNAMSNSGIEASYGITWTIVQPSPPRLVVVAYVEPGSPADQQHILRGATAETIDGVAVKDGTDFMALNKGINPTDTTTPHTFSLLEPGASAPQTVTLTAASVTTTPARTVALTGANAHVGYLVFNAHIATAEKALVDSITKLKADGVDELVLDLRYNLGGLLSIASQLGYMIAGPASAGTVFDAIKFNDKHPDTDALTGDPLVPEPFLDTTQGDSLPKGQALPTLGLKRVFVLTGPDTCSASEAVMNGLSGFGVEVIQIGTTTCGKPYGFYPIDNCGTTYFTIQFQGVNAKGFGDYADGFTPGDHFKGCVVEDDYTHQLGDPAEGRLASALTYIKSGVCPAHARSSNPLSAVDGQIQKPGWMRGMIRKRPST